MPIARHARPLLLLLATAVLGAGDAAPDFARDLQPLLKTYCYGCHNAEKSKGGVDLAQDTDLKRLAGRRKVWQTALTALHEGDMPPEKARQPSAAERAQLAGAIDLALNSGGCGEDRDPGRPALRRLNRSEYDHALSDLLGIDVTAAETFAADGQGYGFDTTAEALTLSPVQVEQYYDAAGKALDALARQPKALYQICFARAGKGMTERDAARAIIARFAFRAYRHPVEAAHLERLMTVYDLASSRGRGFIPAVRAMLAAVLISPRFLIRLEDVDPKAVGPYRVSAYDLASRLSFFLWSCAPDEELLALAASGALRKDDVLDQQARRMLADPRSRALAEDFFGQWLQLRDLDRHQPDAGRFPGFTPTLRRAMGDEAALFIGEIIGRDRAVTELIDADFTFLNEELAKHYGIAGVGGPQMRRVLLTDHRRGGVLTLGATLTVTANPDRTNIPRRGDYVLGQLLGAPPPPPPPMIPALEDAGGAAGPRTGREILEEHRRNPTCAACHAKMDTLGFGLENYDAIGQWRDVQEGRPIDASGVLPGGVTFNGPAELKRILMARKTEFARTMSEMMLTYALGRGLLPDDQCVVRAALAALAADQYRLSALVTTIVRSFPFTHRRNPGQ